MARVAVWGEDAAQAAHASMLARRSARLRGWHIVALVQVVGGPASVGLAQAAREARGPLIGQHADYGHAWRAYDAPLTRDPANQAALIRYWRMCR